MLYLMPFMTGGDEGGDTTKLTYQIVNVNRPNSIDNTIVFAVYEGDDKLECIDKVLSLFAEGISNIADDMLPGWYST